MAFLQWALPGLRMRWEGFRKVRRQACNRIDRRRTQLGLADVPAYRRHLEVHEGEWLVLDRLCRITISRFCRDRGVFEALLTEILPALAREAVEANTDRVRVWSAGCASGEEPYTVVLGWAFRLHGRFPGVRVDVLGTDAEPHLLQRARTAEYPGSSLKKLPEAWRDAAFIGADSDYRLRPAYAQSIRFAQQDLRIEAPRGPFDLVLCRNLAFTYFDVSLQREVLSRLRAALRPGGILLIGTHERLPGPEVRLSPWPGIKGAFVNAASQAGGG